MPMLPYELNSEKENKRSMQRNQISENDSETASQPCSVSLSSLCFPFQPLLSYTLTFDLTPFLVYGLLLALSPGSLRSSSSSSVHSSLLSLSHTLFSVSSSLHTLSLLPRLLFLSNAHSHSLLLFEFSGSTPDHALSPSHELHPSLFLSRTHSLSFLLVTPLSTHSFLLSLSFLLTHALLFFFSFSGLLSLSTVVSPSPLCSLLLLYLSLGLHLLPQVFSFSFVFPHLSRVLSLVLCFFFLLSVCTSLHVTVKPHTLHTLCSTWSETSCSLLLHLYFTPVLFALSSPSIRIPSLTQALSCFI